MRVVRRGLGRWLGASLLGASLLGASLLGASLLACGVSDENGLPKDVEDPTLVLTPRGAIARYRATVDTFPVSVDHAVFWLSALPTDEVATAPAPIGAASAYTVADSRQDWATLADNAYLRVNQLRVQAHEARGLLALYVADSLPALRGHLAALEGYTELFLADAFCSGIPLSTVDVGGDYTLRAGASTEEVYQHAKALFDSATVLASDGSPLAADTLQHLAALGRARALLALGDYVGAAAAVAAVPDDYHYQVTVFLPNQQSWLQKGIDGAIGSEFIPSANLLTMGDRQGANGLDFITSGDPRTPAQVLTQDRFGNTIYYPANYPTTGPVIHTLASGIEARLIEAEAALQQGDINGWLDKLNALRTDGTSTPELLVDTLGVTGCGPESVYQCGADGVSGGHFRVPAGYTLTDSVTIKPLPPELQTACASYSTYAPCVNGDSTLVRRYNGLVWHRGSGGYDRLPLLADPGSAAARVDLMFRERAFWLYLTAHRLGDLRRLVRQYHRDPEAVFPSGGPGRLYGGGVGSYGHEVVIPVPDEEQTYNPQYRGCINRNA